MPISFLSSSLSSSSVVAPTSSSMPSSSWFNLLDEECKGFISKSDVIEALWSVGVSPPPATVAAVFSSLSSQCSLYAGDATPQCAAVANMFASEGLDLDTVIEKLSFWRRTGCLLREDSFQWSTYSQYFRLRVAVLSTPPLGYFFPMVPQETEYEKSIFAITKVVLGGFNTLLVVMLFLTVFLKAGSSLTHTPTEISWSEIFSCIAAFFVTGWSGQAAREASLWTWSGRQRRDKWMYAFSSLRYHSFSDRALRKKQTPTTTLFVPNDSAVLRGPVTTSAKMGAPTTLPTTTTMSAFALLIATLEMSGHLNASATRLTQESAQEAARRKVGGGRPRAPPLPSAEKNVGGEGEQHQESAGVAEDEEITILKDELTAFRELRTASQIDVATTAAAGKKKADAGSLQSRFNILQISYAVVVPQLLALCLSSLPTAFRLIVGLPNLFGASFSSLDRAISCLLFISLFFGLEFVFLVVVSDALSDLHLTRSVSTSLCDLITTSSSDNQFSLPASIQPYKLRLDNSQDVDSFNALYRFVSSYHSEVAACHINSFSCLGVVSLFSASLVFAGALFGVSLAVWNCLLLSVGAVLIAPISVVFTRVCDTHDLLNVRVVRALQAQRRRNEELGDEQVYAQDQQGGARERLRQANSRICRMIENIKDNDAAVLLLGALPLKRENVTSFTASILLVLFSTLIRQTIKL